MPGKHVVPGTPLVLGKHFLSLCVALYLPLRAVRADDFIVYSPYVTATRNEVELRGYRTSDARAAFPSGSAEIGRAHV